MQDLYYVYFVLNVLNGKYYIGQTTRTPELRWKRHVMASKSSKGHFHNAIRYYGKKNFEIRTLFICSNQDILDSAEAFFINLFDAANHDIGYNSRLGGKSSRHTEQTKQKNRLAHLGKRMSVETKNKMSAAASGRKQTPEWVRKRTEGLKGKPRLPSIIQKMKDNSQKGRKKGPLSASTKALLRAQAIGRKHTEETKAKLRKPFTEARRLNIIKGLRERKERLEKEKL